MYHFIHGEKSKSADMGDKTDDFNKSSICNLLQHEISFCSAGNDVLLQANLL